MAMIDTTNLKIISTQENSGYKSTHYVLQRCDSPTEPIMDGSVVTEDVVQFGNKKQRLFTISCGCKMIAELIDKSVE